MSRTMRTAEGTNTGAFGLREWVLLVTIAAIWGSSFLWIAIGLDSMSAPAVAFVRLGLGAAALTLYPPARRPVHRNAWPTIAAIGIMGSAGPALLFALGQQRVESSVAGMINAATPLAVLVVSIAMLGRSPGPRQVKGLLIGFFGVALMASPNLIGADAEPIGVALLLLAVCGYGVSNNLVVPLQQTYGSTAVIMRALVVGTLVLAPWGVPETLTSDPTAGSLAAVAVLGVFGTGVARALSATLAGRAGASRGALVTYLIPIVAIVLGVTFRDESIGVVELAGTALIIVGAYLTSRSQQR